MIQEYLHDVVSQELVEKFKRLRMMKNENNKVVDRKNMKDKLSVIENRECISVKSWVRKRKKEEIGIEKRCKKDGKDKIWRIIRKVREKKV